MSELKPLTELDLARMRALRNGIYHTMRREFFERWERRLNFLVVLLGTATATQVATSVLGTHATTILGVATAAVGGLQLVYNLGGRAREHAMLQGKFYELSARAEERREDEEAQAREIERAFAQLYGSEPPTYHGVNALAYNGAQGAFARDPKDNLVVPWYVKPWINMFTLAPDRFRPARERDAKKSGGTVRLTRTPAGGSP